MPAEIRQFLESYRDAFNRLDGRAVSAHYDLPAMIVHAGGNGVFIDAAALEANNQALCDQYAGDGFVRADFEPQAFVAQGSDFCVADVAWKITCAGKPPRQFNTSYALARRAGAWKVACVTAYEEPRPRTEHG
jgi:ketosteroid isomerase-like protein